MSFYMYIVNAIFITCIEYRLCYDVRKTCSELHSLKEKLAKSSADNRRMAERRDELERKLENSDQDLTLDELKCIPIRKELKISIIDPPVLNKKLSQGPSHC